MRRFLLALLLLPAGVAPLLASPLGLSWGVVSEPAVEGTMAPGRVAEHLEFLQSHGWQPVGLRELAGGDLPARAVVISFDDLASAARYVVPLLELYRMKAVVTVGTEQGRDPALVPVLALLASSPWIELIPRVDFAPGALENDGQVHCGTPGAATSEEPVLSALRAQLATQVERLRRLSGVAPTAVAWGPGAWSGSTEAVAASLGLTTRPAPPSPPCRRSSRPLALPASPCRRGPASGRSRRQR